METNTSVVIEQQDENKKRGALAVILAIAFIAILGIGGTFAYLTWTANQTPNRFSTGELTADLLEPAWTNAALADNTKTGAGAEVADTTYTTGDGIGVPKKAVGMIPGSTVAKNPFVVNTTKAKGDTMKGYAGIKIQFQRWEPAAASGTPAKSDGDDGGTWVNMTNKEVNQLFRVYHTDTNATQVAADNDSTTSAGFTYNTTGGWQQFANAASDAVAADTTNDKWTAIAAQVVGDNVSDANANATGAMYFINTNPIESMGTKKATTATNSDDGKAEDATSSTWGYAVDNSYASTKTLFEHVTYVKNVATAQVSHLNEILKLETKCNDGKVFTPGWRMVISGAIVQAWDPSASSGAGAALACDTSTEGKAVRAALVTALDKAHGTATDPVSRGYQWHKPNAATGLRENSELGKYVDNGTLKSATGVPEATSVDNSGTDYISATS